MTTRLVRDDVSNFRIRRAIANGLGTGPAVNPLVKPHLDELNTLLGKAVFAARDSAQALAQAAAQPAANTQIPATTQPGAPAGAAPALVRGQRARNGNGQSGPVISGRLRAFLNRPLTPKHVPRVGAKDWAANSLADFLSTTAEAAGNLSLSDLIDKSPELAQLKYSFLDEIQTDWASVAANARTILQYYPFIRDYLLAYAFVVQGVKEEDALKNLIMNHKDGVRRIAGYASVSAARTLIDNEQLRVEQYNDDQSAFVSKVQSAQLYLTDTAFNKGLRALIDDFIFDRDEETIIDNADKNKIGDIPASVRPLLIKFMQNSPIKITSANAETYLPHFVLQIMRMQGTLDPAVAAVELPTDDFRVRFEDTTDPTIEVSTSAVQCAAQIYHAMVLGDELDVFGAVHHLTNRRLLMNGGINIKSRTLRQDLQDYVFNNEFIDATTNIRMNRTRPAERQMFYRQLFDYGDAQSPQDMPINAEFEQLWKVLMIESARYLERAQASLHPDSFVSGQGVMQAVEDLQYNLSTNCTGMATVLAPIADAELYFVLERILKHPEIVQQIVPEGGTWKRVVDKLNVERRAQTGNAATLYNKARQGKNIIDAVATYVSGDFDNLGKLSAFIGLVDGFITTQSILQRRRTPQRFVDRDDTDEYEQNAPAAEESEPTPALAAVGADEWDF